MRLLLGTSKNDGFYDRNLINMMALVDNTHGSDTVDDTNPASPDIYIYIYLFIYLSIYLYSCTRYFTTGIPILLSIESLCEAMQGFDHQQ